MKVILVVLAIAISTIAIARSIENVSNSLEASALAESYKYVADRQYDSIVVQEQEATKRYIAGLENNVEVTLITNRKSASYFFRWLTCILVLVYVAKKVEEYARAHSR